MTMTRPCRRITLHLSQIFFTDGWTFTGAALIPVVRGRPRAPVRAPDRRGALVAVDDAAARQVVGRELHDHAVLGQDPDVVLPHLAADVGEHPVPVLQFDPEHRVGKWLDDTTLDLDGPVLLCHAYTASSFDRPACAHAGAGRAVVLDSAPESALDAVVRAISQRAPGFLRPQQDDGRRERQRPLYSQEHPGSNPPPVSATTAPSQGPGVSGASAGGATGSFRYE